MAITHEDEVFLHLIENLDSIGFFQAKVTSSFEIKLKEFLKEKFDFNQKVMKSTILRFFYLVRVQTDRIRVLRSDFDTRSFITKEYFSDLVDILSKHLLTESLVLYSKHFFVNFN
jgi:hypothetical protein